MGLLNADARRSALFHRQGSARASTTPPPGSPTSPFAAAVTRVLAVPGLEISNVFKVVERDVYHARRRASINGPQQPFHYGSWFEDFYISPPPKPVLSGGPGRRTPWPACRPWPQPSMQLATEDEPGDHRCTC